MLMIIDHPLPWCSCLNSDLYKERGNLRARVGVKAGQMYMTSIHTSKRKIRVHYTDINAYEQADANIDKRTTSVHYKSRFNNINNTLQQITQNGSPS